jgi:N-acetylglucosamine malate deacetylase 1
MESLNKKLDILAFAAHPDDTEIACSATLAKHVDMGYRVGVIDLTAGELGSRGNAALRLQESEKATKILGLHHRENLNFADGFFQHNRENLFKIIEKIRMHKPTIVLCNATHDRHPDHARASKLVSDACFYSGLVRIETENEHGDLQEAHRPKQVFYYIQDYDQKPDFVIDVSAYMDKKMQALQAFSSQFYQPNSKEKETPLTMPHYLDFLQGRARHFGRMIFAEFGEGFVAQQPLEIKDITAF